MACKDIRLSLNAYLECMEPTANDKIKHCIYPHCHQNIAHTCQMAGLVICFHKSDPVKMKLHCRNPHEDQCADVSVYVLSLNAVSLDTIRRSTNGLLFGFHSDPPLSSPGALARNTSQRTMSSLL